MWKMWLWDGTTFDFRQGAPDDAPHYGVIIIDQILPDRTVQLLRYEDYYYYDGDQWLAGDDNGVRERLRERLWDPTDVLTNGRLVPDEVFWAIYRAATNDPDYPNPVG